MTRAMPLAPNPQGGGRMATLIGYLRSDLSEAGVDAGEPVLSQHSDNAGRLIVDTE